MSTKGSWSRVDDHKRFENNHDELFRVKKQIKAEMQCLLDWAKAYEEGVSEVEDSVYDAQVRLLQRLEKEHPRDFESCYFAYPMFKDGSWKYTGSFYHDTPK